jgi:Tfp pilus assembly protein PilN
MLVCIFATYMAENYKDEELQKINGALQKMTTQGTESKKQVAKMAELETVQKNLDSQAQAIQAKIDAIRKVVSGRTSSPKLLSSLASAVPQDVWLSDIRMENGTLSLKGGAIGMNKVSDFMKNLKGNPYLSGVELKSTQQEHERGIEVAAFELRGIRRTPE